MMNTGLLCVFIKMNCIKMNCVFGCLKKTVKIMMLHAMYTIIKLILYTAIKRKHI